MSDKNAPRDRQFTYTRRQFWRGLLQEFFVLSGLVKGGQGGQLSELGNLPDEQLAQVRPIVNPDCEITQDEAHVWAKSKKTAATEKLFPAEEENLVAFNLFNGQHTLGEIGQVVSQQMGWDEARGFAHARSLFLSLVSRLVCVPRDPPPSD
jgi:hypothetical protein